MKKTAQIFATMITTAVMAVLLMLFCSLTGIGRTVVLADTEENTDTGSTSDGSYLTDYLGFKREDLVSYLYANMDTFVGTPYHESPDEYPTPGQDGHMQCEGFVWYVLHAVATQNTENIPCGDASTQPYGNGGGWVNWLFSSGVNFEAYDSIDDMLASGTMRKGDIMWLFDAGGPYSISDAHHTGFFWGDTSDDNKFWHSSQVALSQTYAGEEAENRISQIEGMTDASNISVIWVIHLDGSGGTSASATPGEEVIAARRGEADTSGVSSNQDTGAASGSLPDVSAYAAVFNADWYREQLNAGMAGSNSAYAVTAGGTDYSIPRGSLTAEAMDAMTDAELLQYFLLSGLWYGDQASPDFQINWYMENYADSSCGSDRLAYLQHYLQEGIAAGEKGVAEATPADAEQTASTSAADAVISESAPSTDTSASPDTGRPSNIIFVVVCAVVLVVLTIIQRRFRRRRRRHRRR